jgi:hypothetical protein
MAVKSASDRANILHYVARRRHFPLSLFSYLSSAREGEKNLECSQG